MHTIPTPTLEAFCIATGIYDAEEVHILGHTDLAKLAFPFLQQHQADELRQMLNVEGDFILESYTGCILMRVQGSEVLTAGRELASVAEQAASINSQDRREALHRLQVIDEEIASIHVAYTARVTDGTDPEAAWAEYQELYDALAAERAEVQSAALIV